MSKKLAILGHPTRGKEVIELLEMLGGDNRWKASGNIEKVYYTISNGSIIYGPQLEKGTVVFTLEGFLEKYPFKVGDKVVYTKFGDNCDDYPVTIESMKWTGTTVEYTFNDCVTCLAKDLKMWNSNDNHTKPSKMKNVLTELLEHIKNTSKEELEKEFNDLEEWSNVGPTVEEFMTFCESVNRKPKYPKTYKECCKVLGYDDRETYCVCHTAANERLFESMYLLKICRDAYWKIAGNEIGLNKPWEPDWTSGKPFYCISVSGNIIGKGRWYTDNKILAFPTEEMRDAFYGNFKDLIIRCKELL